MFMTPTEIIDTVHKGDSRLFPSRKTPREQWEQPGSGYTGSLREDKLRALKGGYGKEFDQPWETAPPVDIRHKNRTDLATGERTVIPVLQNGHHRLAVAEQRNIPYMAVKHYQ